MKPNRIAAETAADTAAQADSETAASADTAARADTETAARTTAETAARTTAETAVHAVTARPALTVSAAQLDAVVFDMDGVVTQTASVHAAAWKDLFDAYLRERAAGAGPPFEPFDIQTDYLSYVDGKARYDGVRDFLASRGIDLPHGDPTDAPDTETICGLGNRKNGYFLQVVEKVGVRPFPGTVRFIEQLQAAGVRTAVISASENTTMILDAAGVRSLFAAQVDGLVAHDLGLPGKPDPAVFLEAARRLGAEPRRAAVVEDALAGVQAGRAGGFALVIGVDRTAPQPRPGDGAPYTCAVPTASAAATAAAAASSGASAPSGASTAPGAPASSGASTASGAPASSTVDAPVATIAAGAVTSPAARTPHCRDLLEHGAHVVVRDLCEVAVTA